MQKKQIEKISFFGDPNIGLFAKASDKVCFIGRFLKDKYRKVIEEILNVPVYGITISNIDLIGIFIVFNSSGIVLPKIVDEKEVEIIKKLDLNFCILNNTKYTALGNLILCNDKGALISPLLKKEKKEIEETLEVKSKIGTIADLPIVGSCGVANNHGCLLHRDTTEKEFEIIKKTLKINGNIGTVNFGSPFVSSGMLANSNGVLIGELTTGPEMQRIVEGLEFL